MHRILFPGPGTVQGHDAPHRWPAPARKVCRWGPGSRRRNCFPVRFPIGTTPLLLGML
ncbi:Regucalcin [Anopheles sinensis]|uniref:Regucalcin n=1 Tax=Anopheles sinensis TaxID=74873 RepID=A0A084WNN1_ANOSI|nr:Regucalcin [Anopheles sinensis]